MSLRRWAQLASPWGDDADESVGPGAVAAQSRASRFGELAWRKDYRSVLAAGEKTSVPAAGSLDFCWGGQNNADLKTCIRSSNEVMI